MLADVMSKQTTYIGGLLESMGVTIDWLARETGMSYGQTWDIVTNGFKNGTRLGNVEKIARALNIPTGELISKQERQQ